MARLDFSAANGNQASLESAFAAFVTNANVTATSATVTSVATDPIIGQAQYIFNYVLQNGNTASTRVVSFTLDATPFAFGNPAPLATYDFGTGASSVLVGQLGSLHGTGNLPTRIGVLFAGNDTITNLSSVGRFINGYAGNDTITC